MNAFDRLLVGYASWGGHRFHGWRDSTPMPSTISGRNCPRSPQRRADRRRSAWAWLHAVSSEPGKRWRTTDPGTTHKWTAWRQTRTQPTTIVHASGQSRVLAGPLGGQVRRSTCARSCWFRNANGSCHARRGRLPLTRGRRPQRQARKTPGLDDEQAPGPANGERTLSPGEAIVRPRRHTWTLSITPSPCMAASSGVPGARFVHLDNCPADFPRSMTSP
jgi:hypothetical protein